MISQLIKKYLCCHKWLKHYEDTSIVKVHQPDQAGDTITHEYKVHTEILICSECGKIKTIQLENKQ